MGDENLQTRAIDISSDIEDLFESFVLDELIDEDELSSYVDKLGDTKRELRRVISQLKAVEGDDFVTKYSNLENLLDGINGKFQEANRNLREIKKENKNKREKRETCFEDGTKISMNDKKLQSERKFFIEQVNWELKDCAWENFFEVEEIRHMNSQFEKRLDQFYKICSDFESFYDDDKLAEIELEADNGQIISKIRETINSGKSKIQDIKNSQILREKDELEKVEKEKMLAEAKRLEKEKLEGDLKNENLLVCAENLLFEIKTRYGTFIKKCDREFSMLSDYEILDLKKREDNMHVELREFIDKASSFEMFVLPCGDSAAKLRKSVTEMRDKITKCMEKFMGELHNAVTERDISEKKLKNASGCSIEIPKFKGYHSSLDVYTFRSEFSKLVEPNVQKCLWADHLKKCLAGPAYNLVAKMEDVEKMWEKLLEVYGNTQLMFQNKMSSLEKFSNLDKLKDDEKIAYNLTSLLNVMADLVRLAEKYDLEGDLYHGGGLQIILNMLGTHRERKFIKLIAKENLKNKKKWQKLVVFLKNEVKECEAFIINEKAKKCMSLEKFKDEKSDRSDKSSRKQSDNKFESATFVAEKGILPSSEKSACFICGKTEGHVLSTDGSGKFFYEYIACKTFVNLNPRDRDKLLYKKRLCSKCLKPGVKWNSDHLCDKQYSCNQTYSKNDKQLKCEKHVLVCGYHCKEKSNNDLLELFKKNVIANGKFQDFSKSISIACFSETYNSDFDPKTEDRSIFPFQIINVKGTDLCLMYDSGCGDLVVSKEAVDKLAELGCAKQEFPGPILLNGVGNQESVSKYGIYSIRLPLANGTQATMCGICVDTLTVPFPIYPLKKVEKDFREKIRESNPELVSNLPVLPAQVGGKVHMMLGKQYLKYFPKEVAQLESGLTLYKSRFKNPDGTDGVIAGPHPEFSKTERVAHFAYEKKYNYCVQIYNDFLNLVNEVPLLGSKELNEYDLNENCMKCRVNSLNSNAGVKNETSVDLGNSMTNEGENLTVLNESLRVCSNYSHKIFASKKAPKCLKTFEQIEGIGTSISFRCIKCRNCLDCKKGSMVEEISIKDEVEQHLIEQSVSVNTKLRMSLAELPFIADPKCRLDPTNLDISRKVYNRQVKSLAKSAEDRNAVIKAENKLQNLGYVDYLSDLDEADRNLVLESPVKYFIPWLVVWSQSISTPVRPVFNASQRGYNGCSLNDVLAKGANKMNNLVEMLIRWTIRAWGYHTDVRTMYNRINLRKEHWCYQLYLWQKDLDPWEEPQIKVIKTLIYGVRSSGNQAERAIRLTGEKNRIEYPRAYDVIRLDTYVDDVISGTSSEEEGLAVTDELKLSLEKGGFTLKGFTFAGRDPDPTLSTDGEFVSVGGMRWYPRDDYLMVNRDELNFCRKGKGKKVSVIGIPDDLTMRDCVGQVARLFEPLGKMTPIVAGWKLDVSHLHTLGLTWDDKIPDNLRGVWSSNFEMMQEISKVKFRRAIVPHDAKNLQITTLDTADASSKLICAAIYARFERKDGSFSCQLVFARSKVLPEGISIPRGELMAAHLNVTTGFTVAKAFGDYHKRALKLTDSMVALHWVSSQKIALKTWVRLRVIEINRLSDISTWRYVETSNMIADLGTRKGVKVSDVVEGSHWINGLPWMSRPEREFPVFTVDQIKMCHNDVEETEKEKMVVKSFFNKNTAEITAHDDRLIKSRYDFSKYILDPNRYGFRKVIRLLALVLTFIRKISAKRLTIQKSKIFKHEYPGMLPNILETHGDKYLVTTGTLNDMGCSVRVAGQVVEISSEMLKSAMYYYSLKATKEVKHFVEINQYANVSREVDGVLYYSGRILDDFTFEGYPELCKEAIDLCPTTFCVPIMDQWSPVAISIVMEVHWNHPDVRHKGIDANHRQVEGIAHIIRGRNLVKAIKQGCKKCRILYKESIDVVMGPLQDINLCIAPPFFATQVDIFGPFKAYSVANKRATIKVWFSIFCCCTTGGIDIRVMEDYSTDSFVQGFVRFSCRYGYPKYLLPDAGSQLVRGCESMQYSFTDTKLRLSKEYGVQYFVCPVGSHYTHGKVERKIREVKKCVKIYVNNERLSMVQWETLVSQIANSINNHPIGTKDKTNDIGSVDLITPNRLILGRNNERCPNAPLIICADHKRIIENNARIFRAWFKGWLTSYLPSLIERPKWHKSDEDMHVGDIVLFLKSEREYDEQYQYGIVSTIHKGKDGHVRKVDVEYVNHLENVRRSTTRGVRELILVYPIDELDIYERLDQMVE